MNVLCTYIAFVCLFTVAPHFSLYVESAKLKNGRSNNSINKNKRRYLLQEKVGNNENTFNYGGSNQQSVGATNTNPIGSPFSYSSGLSNSRLAVDQSTAALLDNLQKVRLEDNIHGVESQAKIIQEEATAIKNQRTVSRDIEQMKETALAGSNALTNENKNAEYPEIIRAIKWESQHEGKPTKKQMDKGSIIPTSGGDTTPKLSTGRALPDVKKQAPAKKENVDKVQPAAAVLAAKRQIERKNKIIQQQKELIDKIEKRKGEEKAKKKPKTPLQKDSAELSHIEKELNDAEKE
jgi:hypothetical protein